MQNDHAQVAETETVVVKPDWEGTLDQLRATNEQLQKRKADAERDRDLFRDLYSKASTHASQVSKENEELIERTTIAEGQARDGIAMVKKMYEGRVALLESEIAQLRGLNAVLMAKDFKTNGDDLRRRAAEEREVRAQNQELWIQLSDLRMDYDRMEGLLEQLGEEELGQLGEQERELREVGVVIPPTPVEEHSSTPQGPIVSVEQID
ncbi:hypothetical protein BDW22DRAFT_1336687 [Trametopsis cervina]|nr:hypothetical protein BDW22DRAFT_1336687 [Trametopsis cervina]